MTVQVLAHRGASHAERENTIAAFQRARAMGAHGVELDVRRTADGALVVHHDPLVPDGRAIRNIHVADIPEHVPTLDAALDACAGMWVNLEIKNDPREPDFDPSEAVAGETIGLLRRRLQPHRWLISSFRIETVDRCHELAPEIRTAWLTSLAPDDVVPLLTGRGHAAVHPWVGLLTQEMVARCHAGGLQVNTWTCDDPQRMRELVEWGIDGICTNVPDVAIGVIADAAGPS